MQIKDYIFLASKNLSRRKKGVISNTILISISVIICILVISFNICLSNYMNRTLVNNIAYRSIVVLGVPEGEQEEVLNKLEQIDHIIKVVKDDDYKSIVHSDYFDYINEDLGITFVGSDFRTQPSVIEGRNIEDGEKNVCIVPNKFYYKPSLYIDYDKEAYINGEELLGKKISVNYSAYDESNGDRVVNKTFTEEFKVIGVYDEEEYVLSDEWFVSFEDVNRINNNIEENTILNPNVIYSSNKQINAIVDNTLNVESTLEKVRELGYRSLVRSTVNTYIVDIINIVTTVVLLILMLIILFNITTSSIKSISKRKYEIGMLKAIGYRNSTINFILFWENLIIGVRAYLIGLVISIATMFLLRVFLFEKYFELDRLNIQLNILVCIVALLFSIIVPALASLLGGRGIFKKTPVSLNKEG